MTYWARPRAQDGGSKGMPPQRQIAMRSQGQGASTQAALPHAEGKRLDLSATRALDRAWSAQGLYVARDDKCEPLALRSKQSELLVQPAQQGRACPRAQENDWSISGRA